MEILNIGIAEMLVIGIIALMVFGPDRLPEFARRTGEIIGQLRRAVFDVNTQVQREINSLQEPVRQSGQILNSVTTPPAAPTRVVDTPSGNEDPAIAGDAFGSPEAMPAEIEAAEPPVPLIDLPPEPTPIARSSVPRASSPIPPARTEPKAAPEVRWEE